MTRHLGSQRVVDVTHTSAHTNTHTHTNTLSLSLSLSHTHTHTHGSQRVVDVILKAFGACAASQVDKVLIEP
jgi:hypothetical protein